MEPFSVSLAPSKLTQTINPWTWNFQGAQFGLFNIDLGQSRDPALERTILDEVGSYGRQLGRIGDALEVILKHVDLGPADRDRSAESRSEDVCCGLEPLELQPDRRAVAQALGLVAGGDMVGRR